MLIYSHTITPRLLYITRFIIGEITDTPFHITTDIEEYTQFRGPKINYSSQPVDQIEIWIKPVELLFETNIKEHAISCEIKNGYKIFFKTDGDLDFDLFAASFYLLSRYEEYLPHFKDIYGRYAHENSLAYREGFLHQPLVNIWMKDFRLLLAERFPSLQLRSTRFVFIPTYDIDMAWSYKHKGFIRNTGGLLKDAMKGNLPGVKDRLAVLANFKDDPYASFEWLHKMHELYLLQPVYFFLMAKDNGLYDKNINPSLPAMQLLIKQHAERYLLGIHPSWKSNDDKECLVVEKELLEQIIHQKIIYSRQHYLRFHLPRTFRHLQEVGIKHDYSMGYGSINGFRASVANPFLWYDLEKEQQTNLLLHPFCFMDANAFYEQRLSPNEALNELRSYTQQLQQYGGTLITVWHNNFLGTDPVFKGWKDIYHQWIAEIRDVVKHQ